MDDNVRGSLEIDDIFKKTGEFGRYQIWLWVIICLSDVFLCFQYMVPVFIAATPEHFCESPEMDLMRMHNCSEHAIQDAFIPQEIKAGHTVYSSCDIKVWNYTDTSGSEHSCPLESINKSQSYQVKKCDSWRYDEQWYTKTSVTEWDLVCDQAGMASTVAAIYFAGRTIGLSLAGAIVDRFGRYKVLVISIVLHLLLAVIEAFSPSYIFFVVLRACLAAVAAGKVISSDTLCIELVGPSKRILATTIRASLWGVEYVIMAAIAYLIRDWRKLLLVLSVPEILVLVLAVIFLPESPRWLLMRGRKKEALMVLRHIAKRNGTQLSPDTNLYMKQVRKVKTETLFHMFHHKWLLLITLIQCLSWFSLSFVFYGVFLNTGNLGGNPYINFMIASVVDIFAGLLVFIAAPRMGRIWAYSCGLAIGGIMLLSNIGTHGSELQWLGIALIMVGKLFIGAAYNLAWIYAPEVYPTSVRASSMALLSTVSKIANILASFVNLLFSISPVLPLVIFGGLALPAAALVTMLPETKGAYLQQTVEDGEQFVKQNIFGICKRNKVTNITPSRIEKDIEEDEAVAHNQLTTI